ncbi:MAG: hypothetical protein WBG50_23265 [Desulfomonilaceae bacterium]
MYTNCYKMKQNSELSPFQKKIEAIDNVILCVAEVERMLAQIGASLVSDLDLLKERVEKCSKLRRSFWRSRSFRM